MVGDERRDRFVHQNCRSSTYSLKGPHWDALIPKCFTLPEFDPSNWVLGFHLSKVVFLK
jgi:hypothetical protein